MVAYHRTVITFNKNKTSRCSSVWQRLQAVTYSAVSPGKNRNFGEIETEIEIETSKSTSLVLSVSTVTVHSVLYSTVVTCDSKVASHKLWSTETGYDCTDAIVKCLWCRLSVNL